MNRTQEQVKQMIETHKESKQNNAIHSVKSLQRQWKPQGKYYKYHSNLQST